MFILDNILKQFIEVPNDLYEKTNQQIIEVDDYLALNSSTKLVVGYVETCVKHPNADTLSKTTVNIGSKVLDIVCGAPNVRSGQYVIVAQVGSVLPGNFEIKAAVVRGETSNGMICSLKELGFDEKHVPAQYKDGIYNFSHKVTPGEDALKALGLDGMKLLLGLTPNRGDLLSHLGFAYDLASMTNKKVHIPKPTFKEVAHKNDVQVVLDTNNCLTYDLRVMDVVVKESPWWLKNALIQSDIRPINNVVDITNYILITYGTPLHAFDANKVNSNTVLVRQAHEGEEVVTLDEVTRVLEPSDIVITDGNNAIALGGVMGLLESGIDESTTKIMLEAAQFSPSVIAKTSKRLDLRSDSSLRFERGIDQKRVRIGLEAATQLLVELADAKVYQGISSKTNVIEENPWIELSLEHVNGLLGTTLNDTELHKILAQLNYQTKLDNNTLLIQAPGYRKDILIEADVIEEVLRVYGYHHIEGKKLQPNLLGELSYSQKMNRALKHTLVGLGLNEVINYSLVSESDIESFPKVGESVSILMPLSDDRKILRQSLIPGLLKNLNYHLSRQMSHITLFEMGHVFAKDVEKNHLAVLINGNLLDSNYLKRDIKSDFYTLKGILEQIGVTLNVSFDVKQSSRVTALHPGIQGDIYVGDLFVGVIGKTHPLTDEAYDIKDTYVLELDLSKLITTKSPMIFESISKYPSIQRDISFVVSKDYPISDILGIIKQTARKLLTNIEVFDVYSGSNIEEGFHSLAISMTFNNKEKTLEKLDVEKALKSIQNRLEFNFKAVFRA
ncbi:phenylalanine--tRNA ligase subunit beta [Acholeplasma laidlawii]|uniref:phenylalanine--tRNA ligase subunit beta n=1 Tax=Acholeplasma laidlawii TaxID=2148 RepID=UPI0018C32875|nr:phenylalanine--tRNA ligase subunit beta [Acholeplasma laidlawii]MBG0762510.1 phenylalanine--tRNA ligase subunit beta [Acholeplasma laidlawii]